MKHLFNNINQEEKDRILEMHNTYSYVNKKLVESELDVYYRYVLNEGPELKFFTTKTLRNLTKIFKKQEIDDIVSLFTKISNPKNQIIKKGQIYYKTQTGVNLSKQLIDDILDAATTGKITENNMDEIINLIPQYLKDGTNLREYMRNLITRIINKRSAQQGSKVVQQGSKAVQQEPKVGQKLTQASQKTAGYKMVDGDRKDRILDFLNYKLYSCAQAGGSDIKYGNRFTSRTLGELSNSTKKYFVEFFDQVLSKEPGTASAISRGRFKTDEEKIEFMAYPWTNHRPTDLTDFLRRTDKGQNLKIPDIPKDVYDNMNDVFKKVPKAIENDQWIRKMDTKINQPSFLY